MTRNGPAVDRGATVVDSDDVGVIEPGNEFEFAFESMSLFRGGKRAVQDHLECDMPFGCVVGSLHRRSPARPR